MNVGQERIPFGHDPPGIVEKDVKKSRTVAPLHLCHQKTDGTRGWQARDAVKCKLVGLIILLTLLQGISGYQGVQGRAQLADGNIVVRDENYTPLSSYHGFDDLLLNGLFRRFVVVKVSNYVLSLLDGLSSPTPPALGPGEDTRNAGSTQAWPQPVGQREYLENHDCKWSRCPPCPHPWHHTYSPRTLMRHTEHLFATACRITRR